MKQGEGVGCRVLVVVHLLVVGEWAVIMGGPQSSLSMLLKAGMLRRNSFHGNWESNQSANCSSVMAACGGELGFGGVWGSCSGQYPGISSSESGSLRYIGVELESWVAVRASKIMRYPCAARVGG